MDLNPLLRRAVDLGASDIHLKVGKPPMLRCDGAVRPLDGAEPLTDADLAAVLHKITEITAIGTTVQATIRKMIPPICAPPALPCRVRIG